MKKILTIFFQIISFMIYGQVCDTVVGKLINCVDCQGLRSGYWESYETIDQFDDCYKYAKGQIIIDKCNASYCGTRYEYKKVMSSKGYYLNNKKDGKWIIYGCGLLREEGDYEDDKKIGTWSYYGGGHKISLEKQITYYINGGLKESNLVEGYRLEFNTDTSLISGQIYHPLDTIDIDYRDRKCSFILSTGQELISFPADDFDKLEYELFRLKLGIYDREIRIKSE